jgi:predicted ferric reductase
MNELWWYVARSSGIVAWALVAASVLWGLFISTRALGNRVRPNWMLDLHRFLGGAGVVFVGVHVLSLVADNYLHFGLVSLLVPFASTWHPVAVAWGVVAMYLLVAVEITSLLRRKLPSKVWRATHALAFPLFVLSTVHGLTAGTDGSGPMRIVMASTVGAVAVLTWERLREHRTPRPVRRVVTPV